jgi:type I restriction-modification system DNA methylase subunit
MLWNDWRTGRIDRDIRETISELVGLSDFRHLEAALEIDRRLDAVTVAAMHQEIGQYSLYNTDFDFFGLIYESFANTQMKRDFGEFYTPRHIIRTIVKLLFVDENQPRPMKICDPACGTGGFLVESLLYLKRQYSATGALDDTVWKSLKMSTFYGYDTNKDIAIRFARVNMMMAGDSGTNINHTEDSLIHLENEYYDYVLANVPYGQYAGNADMNSFSYTQAKRFELLFVEKIVRSLKRGGCAAVIVPDGLVETSEYEGFRKNLLRDVNITAIISLPPFAFQPYTSEKTYVLFFARKHSASAGTFQSDPIWHFIVDDDGFQSGQKRYKINENDLPALEAGFAALQELGKAGFVSMNDVNEDTFHSLASETYLRKTSIRELSIDEFRDVLRKTKALHYDEWTEEEPR